MLNQIAPAYFHTLSNEQLGEIIETARTAIFSGVDKHQGVRLHYARQELNSRG